MRRSALPGRARCERIVRRLTNSIFRIRSRTPLWGVTCGDGAGDVDQPTLPRERPRVISRGRNESFRSDSFLRCECRFCETRSGDFPDLRYLLILPRRIFMAKDSCLASAFGRRFVLARIAARRLHSGARREDGRSWRSHEANA